MTTLPLDGTDSKQRRQNFPDPDFTILCDPLLGVARYTTKWITSGCDVIAFTTVIRTIAKRANTSIAQGLHSLLHPKLTRRTARHGPSLSDRPPRGSVSASNPEWSSVITSASRVIQSRCQIPLRSLALVTGRCPCRVYPCLSPRSSTCRYRRRFPSGRQQSARSKTRTARLGGA